MSTMQPSCKVELLQKMRLAGRFLGKKITFANMRIKQKMTYDLFCVTV